MEHQQPSLKRVKGENSEPMTTSDGFHSGSGSSSDGGGTYFQSFSTVRDGSKLMGPRSRSTSWTLS